MTVRRYCTCALGGLHIGIDLDRVQEVLPTQTLTPVPLAHPSVSGLFNLRSQIVTAIDGRRRLGMTAPRRAGSPTYMIVVHHGDEALGLVVDSVGDVADVVDEDRQDVPATVDADLRGLLSGAYQVDDTLLLILDVDRATSVTAD